MFDDAQGNYLSTPGELIVGNLAALQGALNLTSLDVQSILADVEQGADQAPLSMDNVSLLYRYGLLARGLKLSVQDLIVVKALSGLNPFSPPKPGPIAELADDYPYSQTVRFVEIAHIVRETGFHVEDLNYLFCHQFDLVGNIGRTQ